jgi:hypothetical protein
VTDLAVTAGELRGLGGVRAIVAKNRLRKHELTILCRARRRLANLSALDRFSFAFGALVWRGERIRKVALGLQPWTLLTFHDALVRIFHKL